jgi:pimeloyl-ACP methyl ester carboxylesterase
MDEVTVVNGDVALRVACLGAGDPVVLLHGYPGFRGTWRRVAARLAPGRRVIAPDLRGFAESGRPVGVARYRLAELVGDAVAVIDACAGGRAMLVGHDLGGLVAWATAIARPDRVARLVVLATPHPLAYLAALDDIRASGRLAYAEAPDDAAAAADRAALAAALARSEPEAVRDLYRANVLSARADAIPRLPPVRVPTLLVRGARDGYAPERCFTASAAHVAAPFRLETLADAGHFLPESRADAVAALILGAP